MTTNYDGLTVNKWTGTWSPTGDHPIVLDREIRGGLRYISGEVGDRLTDIPGQRLQEGMLAYLKKGYVDSGVEFKDETYYLYKPQQGETRDFATGELPNTISNWTELVTGGGGFVGGVNGSVFVSDIEPQGAGESVGEKVFSSDGLVLDSCSSTTDLIRVYLLALPGNTNYKPGLIVNGVAVTNLIAQPDAPLFRGYIDIDLQDSGSIFVLHEDGASHSVLVARDAPPTVTQAVFTGGYPGSQTELKSGDSFRLLVKTDINIVTIEIENYGAFSAASFNVTPSDEHTVTATIANRGTTAQALGAKLRVQKSSGAWSEYYLTEDDGNVDGVNLVNLNNTYPSVTFGAISYPINQNALKGSELATVNHTVTNFNTIAYSSPNNQLEISTPENYQPAKGATRISGDYNISTNNFRITATRAANNATTVANTVVRIANSTPTVSITITGNPARLRSGGNDGTVPQNYTINIVSSQQLISAPTLLVPAGTWQGSGFTGGPTTWSRTLQISDNDAKGSYNFAGLSAINLAGVEQNLISSGATYTLGGFVSRNIPLEAFQNEAQFNVPVVTYSKVTVTWSFNPNVATRAALDSLPPIFRSWCLVSPIGQSPVTVRILDDSYNSSTQQSIITIQETV
jgi:hypothetical protein